MTYDLRYTKQIRIIKRTLFVSGLYNWYKNKTELASLLFKYRAVASLKKLGGGGTKILSSFLYLKSRGFWVRRTHWTGLCIVNQHMFLLKSHHSNFVVILDCQSCLRGKHRLHWEVVFWKLHNRMPAPVVVSHKQIGNLHYVHTIYHWILCGHAEAWGGWAWSLPWLNSGRSWPGLRPRRSTRWRW